MDKVIIKKVFTFDDLRPEVREQVVEREREFFLENMAGEEIDMVLEDYEIREHHEAKKYVTNVEPHSYDHEHVYGIKFTVDNEEFIRHNHTQFSSPALKMAVRCFLDHGELPHSEFDAMLTNALNNDYCKVELGRNGIVESDALIEVDESTEAYDNWTEYINTLDSEQQDLVTTLMDEWYEEMQDELEEVMANHLLDVKDDMENIIASIVERPDADFIEDIKYSEMLFFEDGTVAPASEYSYLDLESARNLKVLRSQIEPDGKNRSIVEFIGGV